jgi:hypothetical protein
MKRKFLAILFIFATCVLPALATKKVKLGDFYYYLNNSSLTAEITYENRTIEANYTGLTIANIPASVIYENKNYCVTKIDSYAFDLCANLISIIIPNSILSIGEEAFDSRKMVSIDVASDNPNYASINGVLFDKNISTLVRYPSGKKGAYSIPNTVSVIGEYAFENCKDLTSIIIPNSVTSIGVRAFHRCHGLTSITIPQSVTSIENQAFYYCDGLTSVTLPDNVTNIASFAFRSCHNLKSPIYNAHCFVCMPQSYKGAYTIPNGIESIAGGAFYQCSQLTSVNIPNSVTNIGVEAFRGCSKLTSPVFNAHCFAYLPRSYKGAFTIPDGIESIAPYAFENCENLTSVTIPNSVISIGSDAFALCKGLTSITIPNSVTSIGYGAFFLCKGLTFVTIGNSVTSIGDETFSCCNSLQEIVYPQGLDISKAGIPSSTKLIAYTPTNSSTNTATASSRSTSDTNSATTSRTASSSTTSQSTTPSKNTYTKPTTSRPICTILSPKEGDPYSTPTIRLEYKIENLSEIESVKFYVNGIERKPKNNGSNKGVRLENGIVVELEMPTENGKDASISIVVVDANNDERIVGRRKLKYVSVHKPTLHVFAVGISEYDYAKTGLQKLQSGAKDAQDFVNTINSLDLSIYKEVKPIIILDKEATANNIRLRLKELADNVDQEDVVMLFLSGHGMTENNLFYFMTHGVRVNECVNALKFNDIVDQMQRMKNKDCHVFIFMDACHSGGMYGQAKGAKETISSAAPDIVGFYSSTADEQSRELNGNGLFTRALIDGLKGNGIANDNGQITIHSLRNYITNALKDAPQTPIFNTKGKDYILFYKKK